ncbi:MAG: CHAT domain-containing protein [Flavobacteriales bacterium]|nr:CHAT domain-containing protein [Flavobacteriales bacterium]
MLNKINFILVFSLLACAGTGFSQDSKWVKKGNRAISKSEVIYEYGDYYSALTKVKRIRKRVGKKGFSSSEIYAMLGLYEAKYLEGIGKIYEVQDSLENVQFFFNMNVSKTSPTYMEGLLVLSDAYAQYGNFIRALEFLDKAEAYFEENRSNFDINGRLIVEDTLAIKKKKQKINYEVIGIPVDSLLKNKMRKRRMHIQMERAYYRESLKEIDELIMFQAKTAQRKLPNPDTTARKKVIKLPKKEYNKRFEEYASLLVLKADLNRMRGDYKKAATLYADNEMQFNNKKLKTSSMPYIRNQFGKSIMAENEGRLIKPSEVFHDIRSQIQKSRKVSNYHKFYNEVTEKEIDSWIQEEKFDKAKNLFLAYKLENRSKYGSQSVYYLRALMLENKLANRNRRYKTAAKREEKLREGINVVIPHDQISNLVFNDHFFDFYKKNNKIEEALIERESNLEVAKAMYGIETPRYAMEEIKLADFNIENEDEFAASMEAYETHFDKVIRNEIHPHHPDYMTYLTMYARLEMYLDQFDKAETNLNEVLAIAGQKYGTSSKEYGQSLIELGKLSILVGDYAKAETQLQQGSELIKLDGNKKSIEYYMALKTLAELYAINSKYELSQATLKEALKYLKKSGETTDQAVGNSEELASIFIETGKYKAAENILKSSIELNEKKYGLDHYKLVNPLRLYGELNLILGEYIEAEKHTTRAVNISKENLGDTSVSYMENLAMLAEIYVAMGNYNDAKKIYNKNLELIRRKFGANNIREVDILRKLAEVNFRSEDAQLDTINSLLNYAKDIVVTNFSASHPMYGEIIEYQGRLMMLFGRYPEAEQLLKDAQVIWLASFGKNHPNSANNEMLMGDLQYLQGNFVLAESSYSAASSSYKSIFDNQHPQYLKARSRTGKTLYSQNKLTEAKKVYDETTEKYLNYLKVYFPALSEKEKGNYWNSIKSDFEIYNSLAVDLSIAKNNKAIGSVYNFKLSTKAILQSSSAKLKERISNSNNGELLYKFRLFNEKKALLTKSLAMSSDERSAAGVNMSALEKEINSLEKELSSESEDFAEAFENEQYTWKDVKKSLKENEYAIEIIRYRHFVKELSDSVIYAALIVGQKTKKGPQLVVFPDGNKMDQKYFKGYRNFIKLDVKDKYSYPQFWASIDERIPDNASVYISADGLYNQMNVETLVDEEGRYIIDKNEIYYLSNTKDLVIRRQEKSAQVYETRTAALFGNPSFAGNASNIDLSNKVSSIEPLPGAEEEIKTVTKLLARSNFKYETRLGVDATEAAVKAVKSPRIFHVATHGFFMEADEDAKKKEELSGDILDNPLLRSGLLFTGAGELLANNNVYDFNKKDGILTAYEAMNLNLDNTELVVLSACETGLGEIKSGEGVYGLQRSFLVAGAQNVIMTLFKVNDKVTEELMSDFYSNWLETGNKRESFVEAKKRVKEKYKSPKLWGSFVLIGLD